MNPIMCFGGYNSFEWTFRTSFGGYKLFMQTLRSWGSEGYFESSYFQWKFVNNESHRWNCRCEIGRRHRYDGRWSRRPVEAVLIAANDGNVCSPQNRSVDIVRSGVYEMSVALTLEDQSHQFHHLASPPSLTTSCSQHPGDVQKSITWGFLPLPPSSNNHSTKRDFKLISNN